MVTTREGTGGWAEGLKGFGGGGFRVPVFDGKESSWRQWSAKFMARAALVGTDICYDGSMAQMYQDQLASESSSRRAARTSSDEDETSLKLERQAYSELLWAVSEVPFYIVDSISADEKWRSSLAWEALRAKYETRSSARKVELRREFAAATMAATQDPDDFIMRLDYLRRQLKDNGVVVTDEDFVTEIVIKLPSVYSELVRKVEVDLADLSLADLQGMVRAFYRRKVQASGAAGAALYTAGAGAGIGSGRDAGSSGTPSAAAGGDGKPSGKGKCSHCGKSGHSAEKCWKLHPEQLPKHLRNKSGKPGKSSTGGDKRPPFALATMASFSTSQLLSSDQLLHEEPWVVDSACTKHLTNSVLHLVNVRPLHRVQS
jgi:gag-polypeptide of LTR copia-type